MRIAIAATIENVEILNLFGLSYTLDDATESYTVDESYADEAAAKAYLVSRISAVAAILAAAVLKPADFPALYGALSFNSVVAEAEINNIGTLTIGAITATIE